MDAMTTTPPDASTILAQWIAEENKVLQALLAGPGPGVARPNQIDVRPARCTRMPPPPVWCLI